MACCVLLTTLYGHTATVMAVSFTRQRTGSASLQEIADSPDQQLLASSSDDRTVMVWNLEQILKLEPLTYVCNWVQDYLQTNVEVEARDQTLCKGNKLI